MISLMQLVTVLFAMVAVSHGEEQAADSKLSKLESRWLGGYGALSSWSSFNYMSYSQFSWIGSYMSMGSYYGCGMAPGFSPLLFAKADASPSVSRRAVTLDSGRLNPRSQETVRCRSAAGESHDFVKSDCLNAATKLAAKGASTGTCGSCKLSVLSHDGPVALKQQIHASVFQKAAQSILETCSNPPQAKSSDDLSRSKNVLAVVLSKSETHAAC